jgi:ABC-type multidrug transport system ATPase subunit
MDSISKIDRITEEYGVDQAATGSAQPEPVVSVRGLLKRYGSQEAVAGIDLEVRRREIFAFLGPNGAGKTTTVEILEGFRQRTQGQVSVLGHQSIAAAWIASRNREGGSR